MPKIASLIIFGLLGIGLGQRRDADDQTQEEGRIEEEKPIGTSHLKYLNTRFCKFSFKEFVLNFVFFIVYNSSSKAHFR